MLWIMQRRVFLKKAGAFTILVIGGAVFRAYGEDIPEIGDGTAFEPWETWNQDSQEGPLLLVRAAIICSNAYNSQPWLFKLSQSSIELYADLSRNLGAFDPYVRELHFSLGCALENLLIAAAANGYKTSLTLLPGKLEPVPQTPKPELVARVDLSSGPRVVSDLYQAIPHRHTNRDPFDAQKPVPSEFVEVLARITNEEKQVKLFLFTEEAERKKIADLIASASEKFLSDPEVRNSTRVWFRTTPEQYQKLADGVYVSAPSSSKTGPLETYRTLMLTGRLFGIISVKDRSDREQTLRAGRIWQRAHLLATARGLAARPANGAVEILDHEKRLNLNTNSSAQLAEITGDASWQPTFMFYMGYATIPAVASARRSVEKVVL
jgi:nitroreductase